jgi:hypothetical protein
MVVYSVVIFAVSGCVGPSATQLRAKSEPVQWTSKKKPADISECLSLAWEPLLIPNFVFVRPISQGYRIDKTSDMGHLYLSVDITEFEGDSKIRLWITKYVWLNSQKKEAKNAVISCI